MTTLRYDADALIRSVRLHGRLSDSGSQGTEDDDILRHIHEELLTSLLPEVLRVREQYNVFTEARAITPLKSRERIPKRAAGQKIARIRYVSGSVNRGLVYIQPKDSERYSSDPTTEPSAYYLEWNNIVLVPTPSSEASGTLEISYPFRPSQVVAVDEVAIISAVNLTSGQVTLAGTVPTAFPTASTSYDIHGPDSGAEIRAHSKNATRASQTLVFTASDIDGSEDSFTEVQVGDYVCLAGECGVPFLPIELHPLLAKRTTQAILRAKGDHEAADKIDVDAEKAVARAFSSYLEDRVEEESQIIVNRNSFLGQRTHWSSPDRS